MVAVRASVLDVRASSVGGPQRGVKNHFFIVNGRSVVCLDTLYMYTPRGRKQDFGQFCVVYS